MIPLPPFLPLPHLLSAIPPGLGPLLARAGSPEVVGMAVALVGCKIAMVVRGGLWRMDDGLRRGRGPRHWR